MNRISLALVLARLSLAARTLRQWACVPSDSRPLMRIDGCLWTRFCSSRIKKLADFNTLAGAESGYGLTREIGWLNREIGPKTVRAHNKSCPAALWDGPACRCSNFFGGNFVAAPDIAQNSAAPARVEFCPIPGAAHARAASATSTPCPPTLPSRPTCCDDRLCTCARAATDAN